MIKKIQGQVKYKVDDFDSMSKKLIELEAIFVGGVLEKTIRYDTSNHKFLEKNIFIRTKSGIKNVLTIKEKTNELDPNILERYTTEIEIDDIQKMEYFLETIGLNKKWIMEKYRLYFKFMDNEITIDELPFGIYLEIKGDDKEIKKISKLLGLKLKDAIKVTYWDIYDKIKTNDGNENIIFDQTHVFKIATYL